MTTPTPTKDPYAPPPVHKEKSGKMVRVVILASVIGVAAAGYALYADEIEEASKAPMVQDEQQFADGGAAVTPSDSDFAPAPAATPAPSTTPQASPTPETPAEDLPPPTTTTVP